MNSNRISALRHEYGMNQRELGEKLGVGQTTVSAWEKGKNEPDHETLYKMAKLLHCSIGYLMGYENNEKTRGLSQEQIESSVAEAWERKDRERFEEELEYQQTGLTPKEIDEYIAEAEHREFEAWLKNPSPIHFEAYKFNQICERINAEQRKHLLGMLEHAFACING